MQTLRSPNQMGLQSPKRLRFPTNNKTNGSSLLLRDYCVANEWRLQKRMISMHQLQLRTLKMHKQIKELEVGMDNATIRKSTTLKNENKDRKIKNNDAKNKARDSKVRRRKKHQVSSNTFTDFPSCDALLSQMDVAAKGSIKDAKLWSEYNRQVLKMLPYFEAVELASLLTIYAKIGYRDPFVFQGIFEAVYWKIELRKATPHTIAELMAATTELRFRPSGRHLIQILHGIKKTSFPMSSGDLVSVQHLLTLAKHDLKNELMKTENGKMYFQQCMAKYKEIKNIKKYKDQESNKHMTDLFQRPETTHHLPDSLLFPKLRNQENVRCHFIPAIIKRIGTMDKITTIRALEIFDLEGFLTL